MTPTDRAQRIIDRLSDRIDAQAMRKGADSPHLVATVGVFHRAAGDFERQLERMPFDRDSILYAVRTLRRIVRAHAVMVALRARRNAQV